MPLWGLVIDTTSITSRLSGRILEVFALALLMGIVPFIVRQDIPVFLHGHTERTITEFCQALLLLMSLLIFGASAIREKDSRAWLVLVTGLFGTMLVRETDMWLDRIVHGFWVYPASLVALASIAYAARNRAGLGDAMHRCTAGQSHAYIVSGLLVLMVFSRLIGSGTLWRVVMGLEYTNGYRSFFQESVELAGYVLVAYGSARFAFLECRERTQAD